MSLIAESALWVGGIGLGCGAALAVAAKYLGVHEDPRIEKLTELLPGVNCGGCGFAGCAAYAAAIAGGAPTNLCAPGGPETVAKLAAFMGVAATAAVRRVAVVLCGGGDSETVKRFAYDGLTDCAAAAAVGGGEKGCGYGCLGYGACVRACPVNAIDLIDGVAVVRAADCIGCGKCVATCPRALIKLVPAERTIHVLCSSRDKGPVVRKLCGVGCIACRICTKLADGAINMDGFLAVVDYTKPLINPEVVAKCPAKCIRQSPAPAAPAPQGT